LVLALSRKGQVSIEFILIITIALFYITSVVWPIVLDSTNAAEDVKDISDTKISAMKLANALNEAESSSGYMKKTIRVLLPFGAEISGTAGVDEISLIAYVDAGGGNPDEINCTEIIAAGECPNGAATCYKCTSTISLISGAGTTFNITGPIFKNFVVEKGGLAGVTVS